MNHFPIKLGIVNVNSFSINIVNNKVKVVLLICQYNQYLYSQYLLNRKCDENLLTLLKKKIPNISVRNPHHISTRVSDSDIQGKELAKKLINEFEENFGLATSKGGFGLIGLHPCGNLAGTLLKLYATQTESRFICIVGCCYMKITPGYDSLKIHFAPGTNP